MANHTNNGANLGFESELQRATQVAKWILQGKAANGTEQAEG